MIKISYTGLLIADTDISNWSAGVTDSQQGVIIKRTEEIIEKVCHDKFYQYNFTEIIDGNGKNRILLPFLSDILSLSKVKIGSIDIDTSLYTFDGRFVYANPEGILIGGMTAIFSDIDVLFPKGVKNITIIGTCGYATTPESIKRAAIILCENENDASLYSHYISGSESEGSYSVSHKRDILTGILEADELLDNYIRRKPMMFA